MRKKLLGELALKYEGRPIAVLCGGPSLKEDLPKLEELGIACWISANDHALKLKKCDYIVAGDLEHMVKKVSMGEYLKQFGVPIISPQMYADYRIHDWTYGGNSGMYAIVVAHILGGWPIYVAGMDFYRTGTYFHSLEEENVSTSKSDSSFVQRMRALKEYLKDSAFVRFMRDGLQSEVWQTFKDNEVFPNYTDKARKFSIQWKDKAETQAKILVTRQFHMGKLVLEPEEHILSLSEAEALVQDRIAEQLQIVGN